MKKSNDYKQLWDIAEKVAYKYEKVPSVSGVVVGGSLARGFTDKHSDIEMYAYYTDDIPSKKEIGNILKKLNAPLTRSKNMHWYHPAWGHHTFFSVDNISIELGYRNIESIEKRLKDYLAGETILSKPGIHDTPFGHYESGIASCIKESKIIFDKHGDINLLKRLVNKYPDFLQEKIINYYMEDVVTLTQKKLYYSVLRNDTFNFNAVLANILRSMNIVLFAINKVHFPGDKWNARYIEKFKTKPKNYDKLIYELFNIGDSSQENKETKLRIIHDIINGLEKILK